MLAHTVPIASDLVAIVAVATMYFHRHQRRDLLLAYVALNTGILSVTLMLTSASVGVGLGLGLFGILSRGSSGICRDGGSGGGGQHAGYGTGWVYGRGGPRHRALVRSGRDWLGRMDPGP